MDELFEVMFRQGEENDRRRATEAAVRTADAAQRQVTVAEEANRIAAEAHKRANVALWVSLLTAFGVIVTAIVTYWDWFKFEPPQ